MKTMSGAISFFELGVADADKGRAFYEGLFGWEFETGPSGNGWVISTPGVPGGMHPGDAGAVPYVFFAVEDMDAAHRAGAASSAARSCPSTTAATRTPRRASGASSSARTTRARRSGCTSRRH